jgi:hypothetical protein
MRARTGVEDCVGGGGIAFLRWRYPLTMFFSREPAVPMIMSIYVTLGIFLLLAVRDPAANRSLIAFGGWANLAHAGVMAVSNTECDRAPRTRGSGCVRNRWCGAGRTGSGEAISRESVGDHRLYSRLEISAKLMSKICRMLGCAAA